MRDLIASVAQLAGIGCLVAAGFLFSVAVGLVVLGAGFLLVGFAIDRMPGKA